MADTQANPEVTGEFVRAWAYPGMRRQQAIGASVAEIELDDVAIAPLGAVAGAQPDVQDLPQFDRVEELHAAAVADDPE